MSGAGFRHATGRDGVGRFGVAGPRQERTRSFGVFGSARSGGTVVVRSHHAGVRSDVSDVDRWGERVVGGASAGTTGLDGGVARTGVDGGVTGCWVAHRLRADRCDVGGRNRVVGAQTGRGRVGWEWARARRRAPTPASTIEGTSVVRSRVVMSVRRFRLITDREVKRRVRRSRR